MNPKKSYAFESREEVLREIQSLLERIANQNRKKLVGARQLDGSPIDGDVDMVSYLYGEHLKFTANINPEHLLETHPAPKNRFYLELNVEKIPDVEEYLYLADVEQFMKSLVFEKTP